MNEPKPGDRVRITAIHEGVIVEQDELGGRLRRDDGTTINYGTTKGNLQLEVIAPAERWHAGDVVRNGDDPEDERCWLRGITEDDGGVWLGPDVNGHGAWLVRDSLPANLTLIVRDGRPVLPEPTDEDLNAADLAFADARHRAGDFSEYGRWRAAARVLDERRGVIRP